MEMDDSGSEDEGRQSDEAIEVFRHNLGFKRDLRCGGILNSSIREKRNQILMKFIKIFIVQESKGTIERMRKVKIEIKRGKSKVFNDVFDNLKILN